jgi:hypothetical protein
MNPLVKPIRLSGHAREQVARRGTTQMEVTQAIREAEWTEASGGRWECRLNFSFKDEWNGKHYDTKQVRPIFVEDEAEIVVVTVYTYFF